MQHGHPSSPRTDRARRTRSCGGVKHRKYLVSDFTKDLLTGFTSSPCSLGPTFSAPVAAERRNNAAALPELPRGGEERRGAARPGPERHALTHLPDDFQAAFNRSASVPEGGRAPINEARCLNLAITSLASLCPSSAFLSPSTDGFNLFNKCSNANSIPSGQCQTIIYMLLLEP